MGFQLAQQARIQRRSDQSGPTRDGFGLHVAALAALFEIALDRRDRDRERLRDLRLGLTLIDSPQDALP